MNTRIEYSVRVNDTVKYFDFWKDAYEFYCEQCKIFGDFWQPTSPELEGCLKTGNVSLDVWVVDFDMMTNLPCMFK